MDFDESLGVEVLSEQLADTRLESEDSLVSGNSQVNDSVVQSHVLLNASKLIFIFLFLGLFHNLRVSSISFFGLVHHDSASVSNLERQDGHGDSNVED